MRTKAMFRVREMNRAVNSRKLGAWGHPESYIPTMSLPSLLLITELIHLAGD